MLRINEKHPTTDEIGDFVCKWSCTSKDRPRVPLTVKHVWKHRCVLMKQKMFVRMTAIGRWPKEKGCKYVNSSVIDSYSFAIWITSILPYDVKLPSQNIQEHPSTSFGVVNQISMLVKSEWHVKYLRGPSTQIDGLKFVGTS